MLKSVRLIAAAAALCLGMSGIVMADGPRVLQIGFILAQQPQLGTAANQILVPADELGRQAETLRAEVDRFLVYIRAA